MGSSGDDYGKAIAVDGSLNVFLTGYSDGTWGTVNPHAGGMDAFAVKLSDYTLSVTISPSGGGSVTGTGINCPGDCTETYGSGFSVTLTATASTGYTFDSWSGDLTGSTNPDTITMDSDKSVTVVFTGASEQETMPQIAAGTAQTDFGMVSFTHRPDDPSAAGVFGITYDTKNYKIGTYDPTTEGYIEYNNLTIEPGKAYWVLARNGLDITYNGVPVSLLNDIEVKLDYNSSTGNGWNMVAPPNGANYLWENVEIVEYDSSGNIVSGPTAISALSDPNDYIDKRLWRWENGSYYSDAYFLEAYQGYWVKVKKANVHLIFPPSAQATLSNPSTKFAGLFSKEKRWVKGWIFAPRSATADSGDSPPLPMGGLSSAPEGASGGCFISTTAY